MKSIYAYFQTYHPFHLKPYKFFEIGNQYNCYYDMQRIWLCQRIASKCCISINKIFFSLIKKYLKKMYVAYSTIKNTIEQLQRYTTKVIDSFKHLVDKMCKGLRRNIYV